MGSCWAWASRRGAEAARVRSPPQNQMTAQGKATIQGLYLEKEWMESDRLRNKSF